MIIEKLTRLDGPKRTVASVVAVLVVAGICYLAIARRSLVTLQAAEVKRTSIQALCDGIEDQRAELLNLQEQIKNSREQIEEYQEQYFTSEQAAQFFENINSMALAYNLKPISRMISEPSKLIANKVGDEETKPQEQFLKKQSAKVAVSGNYFDIVDFVKELVDRPQQVCITNLHVALPVGESSNPKAAFEVTLFIDSSKEDKP